MTKASKAAMKSWETRRANLVSARQRKAALKAWRTRRATAQFKVWKLNDFQTFFQLYLEN